MIDQLYDIIPESSGRIKLNEPMNTHTTFRVGGPADYFVEPANSDEIVRIVAAARAANVPLTLLGNGSNVVVSDRGIRGLVLYVGSEFARISLQGNQITVQAGAQLASVAAFAARHSLSGLEFASGIPGTVGGAVMMNAGAYEHCMSEVVIQTEFVDNDLKIKTVCGDEHGFGYRKSRFSGQDNIILGTVLQLKLDDSAAIYERMAELAKRRRTSQPLEFPSAGSAFKRPAGYYAGKLISDCGLKGCRIGGAEVSTKHAGFIINIGGATADDIRRLFLHVQAEVYDQAGVILEPEVRFIGDWEEKIAWKL